MKFKELEIDHNILKGLDEAGIHEPFPIQQQAIPLALQGKDLIAQAKTGTGKTFAFLLPILQHIVEDSESSVQALIVVPTRELAVQVHNDLLLASKHCAINSIVIYGGANMNDQIQRLRKRVQIVVGTPGRLLDLQRQKELDLSHVRELVLDEADKMLDLGFLPDIEQIFSSVPEARHTMLFSATMPDSILTLAKRFMRAPVHIRQHSENESDAQTNIRHIAYRAHAMDKAEMIAKILQGKHTGKTVIFARTKFQADRLGNELRNRGFRVATVHGDMRQEQRERSMEQFRLGKRNIFIATDVAARGIDVQDVTHVINYTIPSDAETYVHRVGRTGRAGKTGVALTLVDWEDLHKWELMNKELNLGCADPVETYSSSPQLFEDFEIDPQVRGRLKAAAGGRGAQGHAQRRKESGQRRAVSRERADRNREERVSEEAQMVRKRTRNRSRSRTPQAAYTTTPAPNNSKETEKPARARTRQRRRLPINTTQTETV